MKFLIEKLTVILNKNELKTWKVLKFKYYSHNFIPQTKWTKNLKSFEIIRYNRVRQEGNVMN